MTIKAYAIAQAGEEAREVFVNLPEIGRNNNRRRDEAIKAAEFIRDNPAKIAAVDELLEALKAALNELETMDSCSIKDPVSGEYVSPDPIVIRDIRAAIQKAEGR